MSARGTTRGRASSARSRSRWRGGASPPAGGTRTPPAGCRPDQRPIGGVAGTVMATRLEAATRLYRDWPHLVVAGLVLLVLWFAGRALLIVGAAVLVATVLY